MVTDFFAYFHFICWIQFFNKIRCLPKWPVCLTIWNCFDFWRKVQRARHIHITSRPTDDHLYIFNLCVCHFSLKTTKKIWEEESQFLDECRWQEYLFFSNRHRSCIWEMLKWIFFDEFDKKIFVLKNKIERMKGRPFFFVKRLKAKKVKNETGWCCNCWRFGIPPYVLKE